MSQERLEHLKQMLMCCVEGQMSNLQEVDAGELGEAIDMLKDLEEAIYFNTITEAMKGKKKEEWSMENSRSYNDGGMVGNSRSYYGGESMLRYTNNNGGQTTHSEPSMERDGREGRSPMIRRMYMEAKHNQHDKATQLRELEKYMTELQSDIIEMISDASSEEKSYIEKKMTTLASKIGQMK